jgi:O-antigen/teichoic acid export membrane protein
MRDIATMLASLLRNSVFAFVARVSSQFVRVLLSVLLARWYGAAELGVFSLSVRYTNLFLAVAMWGLDELLIREVARERSRASSYFANFSLVRLFLGVVSYSTMAITVLSFANYSLDVKRNILLLGISVIPQSLSRLAQALLSAYEEFDNIVRISLITSALNVFVSGIALQRGANLEIIILVQVLVASLSLVMYVVTILCQGLVNLCEMSISQGFVKDIFRRSLSFACIELGFNIGWQIDFVLLSFLVSEKDLGYFGGAQIFISGALLALSAYHSAIYPLMTRLYANKNKSRLWQLYRRLFSYGGAFSLITGISVTAASSLIITTVYGPGFEPAIVALEWLIWSIVVYVLGEPNSRLVIIAGYQKFTALFLGLSTIINILTNLLLVPSLGILGAACARVLSATVFTILSGLFVFWRVSPINLISETVKLLVAGMAMVGVVFFFREISLWLAVALGGGIFVLIAFIVRLIPISDQHYLIRLIRRRIQAG